MMTPAAMARGQLRQVGATVGHEVVLATRERFEQAVTRARAQETAAALAHEDGTRQVLAAVERLGRR
ncbi:hypothetical protein AB0E78_39465 [Streptomyces sp. NPDC032198]|uniref:hypothetical protein n=1 Tax=Streptomyces sp. NPDC032198 TaxID=3155127 RepID=UPI00340A557C